MNGPDASPARVALSIDGRPVAALAGTYVLAAARRAGIDIPTLCDHPALEPVGACRLCLVEVTHRDWNGWTDLVTSCLYPVSEGLEIRTKSPRVVEARRRVLALLSARCPSAAEITKLATEYGVDTERLERGPLGETCIVCGLCTRVCETYATSAIATHGRGLGKAVGPPAGGPAEDCVGCGGCAAICPTGTIAEARDAAAYAIWSRSFATAHCHVDAARCTGCGACEEACPFRVARVALRAGGLREAVIPAEHCRGCGACVGACPSGAIAQDGYDTAALLAGARPEGAQP